MYVLFYMLLCRNSSKLRVGHARRARQTSFSHFINRAGIERCRTQAQTHSCYNPQGQLACCATQLAHEHLSKCRNRGPITFPNTVSSPAIAAAAPAPAPSVPQKRGASHFLKPKAKTDPLAVSPSSRNQTHGAQIARSDPVKLHIHRDASGYPTCDDTDSDVE